MRSPKWRKIFSGAQQIASKTDPPPALFRCHMHSLLIFRATGNTQLDAAACTYIYCPETEAYNAEKRASATAPEVDRFSEINLRLNYFQ
jgi:hypothetical protein